MEASMMAAARTGWQGGSREDVTLERFLGTGFTFASMLLAAVVVTAAGLYQKHRASARWIHESREAGRVSREMQALLFQAEVAHLSHVITRDPAERATESALIARLGAKLDSLEQMARTDGRLLPQASEIRMLVAGWHRISLRGDSVSADAANSEPLLFARLRDRIMALSGEEDARYRRRLEEDERWQWRAVLVLAGELLAIMGVLFAVRSRVRRQARIIAHQRDHAREQNRQLSEQTTLLLEQREQLETQATELESQTIELEEHASELEVTNRELEEAAAVAERARRAAEEASVALQVSEDRYRTLFECNPMPMWVFERHTLRFLAVNDAAVREYGYSREEFAAISLLDIRPPEDQVRVRHAVQQSGENLGRAGRWRHLRKDGSMMHVEVISHAIEFEGYDARLALITNITERVAAEQQVAATNALVEAVISDSPLAIIILDLALVIQRWNPAAERLLGGAEAHRVGTSYMSLVPEDLREQHGGLRAAILRGEVASNIDTERVALDGSLVDVTLSLAALHDARGAVSGIVVVMADRRERKELETRFLHSQKLEAVGQLAGGVAHDFNNLLTVISSYSQSVLSDLPVESALRADVEEIRGAAERATVLTRQLLAFSRQQILRPAPLAVNQIVSGMRNMLMRLVREDIRIVLDLQKEPGVIRADGGQVEQVIVNLVVNARDAMPRGGRITITTRGIELAEEELRAQDGTWIPAGRYVMLAVEDTGVGIAPEMQARVFEPFFTTKEVGKGTGLGLSTVYGIVRQSRGQLVLESEHGRGATFRIYFPAVEEELPQLAPVILAPESQAAGERIVLVEDDQSLRAVSARVLRREGYEVVEARGGREALEACERLGASVSLLIADLVLPELSGQAIAREVTLRHPSIKVLLMSGYMREVAFEVAGDADEFAFLEKPFTPDRLVAAVRAVLEGSVAGGA